jgi:hypothetical protein
MDMLCYTIAKLDIGTTAIFYHQFFFEPSRGPAALIVTSKV